MGKMTQELIEDLYIRGRAVYKKKSRSSVQRKKY